MKNPSENEWTQAEIALSNVGGIRTGLEIGDINFAAAVAVMPFENKVVIIELRGDKILDSLEYSVFDADTSSFRNFLHYSGMQVKFNYKNSPGNRVESVRVLCRKCKVPVYEPLDVFKNYRLIMPEFLANGGDGFVDFPMFGKLLR